MLKNKIFLLLSLILGSELSAFVSYNILINDKNQIVFCIGDWHNLQVNDFNEQNVELFLKTINILNHDNSQNNIKCLIELPNESYQEIKNKSTKDRVATSFLLLAQYFAKNDNKKINFESYEPRTPESEIINALLDSLSDLFFEESPDKEFDKNIIDKIKIHRKLTVDLQNKKLITIVEYKQFIENYSKVLKKLLENYNSSEKIYKTILEKIELFNNGLKEINKYFDGKSDEDSLEFILMDLFKKCKNYYQVRLLIQELYKNFLHSIDYNFADILFYNKVIQEQDKNLNNIMILITGQHHTENVSKMLSKTGYKLIKQINLYKNHNFNVNSFNPSNQFRFDLALDLINSIGDKTFEKNENYEKKINEEVKYCNYCFKQGDSNLKVCTNCRKIRYCNQDHQIKDWQEHKKTCKKA